MDFVLLNTIRQSQAALADADFLTWLQQPVYSPKSGSVMITWLVLRAMFPAATVAAVAQAVTAADPMGNQLMYTTGVDLLNPQVQGMLAQLVAGGVVTMAQASALADLGRTSQPQWQASGLDSLPTLEMISGVIALATQQTALNSLAAKVQSFYANAMNEAINPMLTQAAAGQTLAMPTLADLVAKFGGG